MNKQQLIEKHETNKISKAQLGQLRRIVLEELLEDITKMDSHHVAEWLDKKRSKLAPAKLANAVGYGTTTDTLRQSLKPVVIGIGIATATRAKKKVILIAKPNQIDKALSRGFSFENRFSRLYVD